MKHLFKFVILFTFTQSSYGRDYITSLISISFYYCLRRIALLNVKIVFEKLIASTINCTRICSLRFTRGSMAQFELMENQQEMAKKESARLRVFSFFFEFMHQEDDWVFAVRILVVYSLSTAHTHPRDELLIYYSGIIWLRRRVLADQ